ncbi:MAG TPA: hypothetical protein VFR70_11430 [Flavobacterium sp.]|nr:hypothetical protein [Flavobacterium sp.]
MKSNNLKYSFIAVSILAAVLLLLYVFPNKSSFNDPERFWKAGGKPVIGDAFHLSEAYGNLKNDTIFAQKIPVAVVLKLENRFWLGDRVLTVKSIKTGEIGKYYEE